jgi:hypothetical protein
MNICTYGCGKNCLYSIETYKQSHNRNQGTYVKLVGKNKLPRPVHKTLEKLALLAKSFLLGIR